jgi:hypothetical protein
MPALRLKLAARVCIYRTSRRGDKRLEIEVLGWATDIRSFMVRERIESPRAHRGITVQG